MNTGRYEPTHWPVYWSAIWVGTLTALAVGLMLGLLGYAFGAHEVANHVDWDKLAFGSVVFSIAGAFFAFVAGGGRPYESPASASPNRRFCTLQLSGCSRSPCSSHLARWERSGTSAVGTAASLASPPG